MALSIKSIIQQAMLAAAPVLAVGCSADDQHVQIVIPTTLPDGTPVGSSLSADQCFNLCVSFPPCAPPNFKGCTEVGPSADGGIVVDCNEGPPPDKSAGLCTGRRPAG